MPFITQGKTNLKYILIVVVLAVVIGGGIFVYQYLWDEERGIFIIPGVGIASAEEFASIYYDVDYARRKSAQLFAEMMEQANKAEDKNWQEDFRDRLKKNQKAVADAFKSFNKKLLDRSLKNLHENTLSFYKNLEEFEKKVLEKLIAVSDEEKTMADIVDEIFELEPAWEELLSLDREIQDKLKSLALEKDFTYEEIFYDDIFRQALVELRNPSIDPNSPPGTLRTPFNVPAGTNFVQVSVILLDKVDNYTVTLIHPSGKKITSETANSFTISRYVKESSYTFFELSNKDPFTAPIEGDWEVKVEAPGGTEVQFLINAFPLLKIQVWSPQEDKKIPLDQDIEINARVFNPDTNETIAGSFTITVLPRYNRLDKKEGGYKDLPSFKLTQNPDQPGYFNGTFQHSSSLSGTYWYTFKANAKGKTEDGLSIDLNAGYVGEIKIRKTSQIHVDISFQSPKQSYQKGDQIVIEATPIDPNDYPFYKPVVGAIITMTPRMAYDIYVAAKWQNLQEIPMLDNGNGNDLFAGDGVYTATFDSSPYPKADSFGLYVLVKSTPDNDDIYTIQYSGVPLYTGSEGIGF